MWSEELFTSTVSRGRDLLAQGGEINGVIALAHDEGFPFIQCVRLLTKLVPAHFAKLIKLFFPFHSLKRCLLPDRHGSQILS